MLAIALPVAILDKSRGLLNRPNSAITDVLDEFRRVEQFKDERRIGVGDLTKDEPVGFKDSHAVCRLFRKRPEFARFAKHLVHLVEMQFLKQDHLTGVLFKRHRLALA